MLVLGLEGLRRLVRIDGELRLVEGHAVKLPEPVQRLDDLDAVLRLFGLFELRLEEPLDAFVVAGLPAQGERLVERLRKGRVELEGPVVECDRLVGSRPSWRG